MGWRTGSWKYGEYKHEIACLIPFSPDFEVEKVLFFSFDPPDLFAPLFVPRERNRSAIQLSPTWTRRPDYTPETEQTALKNNLLYDSI